MELDMLTSDGCIANLLGSARDIVHRAIDAGCGEQARRGGIDFGDECAKRGTAVAAQRTKARAAPAHAQDLGEKPRLDHASQTSYAQIERVIDHRSYQRIADPQALCRAMADR